MLDNHNDYYKNQIIIIIIIMIYDYKVLLFVLSYYNYT